MLDSKDKIQLFKGDCLEIMDKLIEKGIKVDLILTDIPYGTTNCKWDSIIPFDKMWDRLNKIKINKATPIVLFGSEPFSSALRMSNIKEYKYDWKWNKTVAGNPLVAKYRPLGIFEDIIVFGKGKINYHPIMEEAKPENIRPIGTSKKKTDLLAGIKSGEFQPQENYNPNMRYPKNEIVISSRANECNPINRLHPTQKPVELLEYLIKTYSNEGDTVLDFTMGSGSTGEACLKTNRNFIGIEQDDKYFNVSVNRVKQYIEDNNLDVELVIVDK